MSDVAETVDASEETPDYSTGFSETIAETRTFSNLFDDNVIDRNMGRKISSDLGFDQCRTLNFFRGNNAVVDQGAAL